MHLVLYPLPPNKFNISPSPEILGEVRFTSWRFSDQPCLGVEAEGAHTLRGIRADGWTSLSMMR